MSAFAGPASAAPKKVTPWLSHCQSAVDAARTQAAKIEPRFAKTKAEAKPAEVGDDDVLKLKINPPKAGDGFELTTVHYPADRAGPKPGWQDASENIASGRRLFLQRNAPRGHAYIVANGWPAETLDVLAVTWKRAVDACFAE